MDIDRDKTDAHQIALELMKQIITLGSGVVALSATFLEKFEICTVSLALLALSWSSLLFSIFFGLQTISAIVKSRLNTEHDWSTGDGQRYARYSKYAFIVGIVLFAAFAFTSFLMARVGRHGASQMLLD